MSSATSAADRAVATIAGSVPPEALGRTLVHEHLVVTDLELERNLPHPEWDEEMVTSQVRAQLQRLADRGVQTIVDLTVPGLGRDIRRISRMVEGSPVHIVVSTGFYTSHVLPNFFALNGPGRLVDRSDPLAEMFYRDITEGIAGTRIRAGMLKVASGVHGMTEDVLRVFYAAGEAHRATGVPITTHSEASIRGGVEQQRVLAQRGVPLERVVIGHSGDSRDIGYLCALADEGSFLGFDRFGMEHLADDGDRLDTLVTLLEKGYEDHLLISQDAAVFSAMTPPSWRRSHAPHWHMEHIVDTVLPRLRRRGLTPELERTLLVDNPRRLLAGPASGEAGE